MGLAACFGGRGRPPHTGFGGKWAMTAEQKILQSVAMQLMNGDEVVLDDAEAAGEAGREWAIADGGVYVEWAGV